MGLMHSVHYLGFRDDAAEVNSGFRKIDFPSASSEIRPGPNARTIKAANQNTKGSALTNLSGSLTKLENASISAVTYATVIEMKTIRATGREKRPTISRAPPKHSSDPTNQAFKPGNGIPRLEKN